MTPPSEHIAQTPVDRPGWLRIADDIRIAIEHGELGPGDPIPSLGELVDTYGVSQGTARQAHNSLRTQALVTGGQGKRLLVRTPPPRITFSNAALIQEKQSIHLPEEVRRRSGHLEDTTGISIRDATFTATYTRIVADDTIPEYDPGTPLLQREYETVETVTGRRLAWSTSFLPISIIEANPKLLDQDEEPWPGGTQHQLSTVGVEVAHNEDTITARAPTTIEIKRWEMDPGIPILRLAGRMTDPTGRVVCATRVAWPADRAELRFVLDLPKAR